MIFLDIEVSKAEPEPWMLPEAENARSDDEDISPHDLAYDQSSLQTLCGGFIVCVGVAVDDKAVVMLENETVDEAGELAMLRRLELGFGKNKNHPVIAYNGARYDFLWLRHRGIRHGLYDLSARMWQDKPWDTKCIDPFLLWNQGSRNRHGRLTSIARFLGIDIPDTISGSDVQGLIDAGDMATVMKHCVYDVELLREVFKHMVCAGWVPSVPRSTYEPQKPAPLRLNTIVPK